MSQDSLLGHRRLRVAVPMTGRDPDDRHRASTPLELFFDLVFVVAVALAADELGHGVADGEWLRSSLSFTVVFFTIYWAWVNFTWFASAYDTDDLVYRLFVFVTIVGALIFAAGVPRAFAQRDFAITASGYVVMRVALLSQWSRVALGHSPGRAAARRFVVGLTVLQIGWTSALVLPARWYLAAWLVLAVGELSVPAWAEAAARTTWNPVHIAERYGLFMMIVLGESVLAASHALQTVLAGDGPSSRLVPIIVGGLLLLFSVWWTYFERPGDHLLSSQGGAFAWSYLHLLVFASVAALGAGLAVAIEAAAGEATVPSPTVAAAIAVPFAVYLLSLWGTEVRRDDPPRWRYGAPVATAAVLAASATPYPVLAMGLVAAAAAALKTTLRLRTGR